MVGGILIGDNAPGMPTGAGAFGRTDAAYGMDKPVLLLGRPVDSRLGLLSPNRCVQLSARKSTPQSSTEECVSMLMPSTEGSCSRVRFGVRSVC
jgi:hypothetical protein